MALTRVKTAVFTTAVPTGWEIHLPGSGVLEAYDPVSTRRGHTVSLKYIAQPAPNYCNGEKVETVEGPTCVNARDSSEMKIPATIVEVQTPKHWLRITHAMGQLEKPASLDDVRALALRIINDYGEAPTPSPSPEPSPSPSPEVTAEAN